MGFKVCAQLSLSFEAHVYINRRIYAVYPANAYLPERAACVIGTLGVICEPVARGNALLIPQLSCKLTVGINNGAAAAFFDFGFESQVCIAHIARACAVVLKAAEKRRAV